MDMVTCAGSFLLGGVSAIILMGLLLLFIEKSPKKSKDDQLPQRRSSIALLPLTEFKNAAEIAKVKRW